MYILHNWEMMVKLYKFGRKCSGRVTGRPRNIVNNLFTIAHGEYSIMKPWRPAERRCYNDDLRHQKKVSES